MQIIDFLRCYKNWTEELLRTKKPEEIITVRDHISEGWLDVNIETMRYSCGSLINSEQIHDMGAVDKITNKTYDKLVTFTTVEALRKDLNDFTAHLRNGTLDKFLIELSPKRR